MYYLNSVKNLIWQKKSTLYLYTALPWCKRRLLFVLNIQPQNQHNCISIHTTWTLLKMYHKVSELIFVILEPPNNKNKMSCSLNLKRSTKYFKHIRVLFSARVNSSAKRQNAMRTLKFGNSSRSYLPGVNLLLSLY